MSLTWAGFIESLNLKEESKAGLSGGLDPEYILNERKMTLKIRVTFPSPVSGKTIRELEEEASALLRLAQVRVCPRISGEDLDALSDYLDQRLRQRFPLFEEGTVRPGEGGNALSITLISRFHEEVYLKQGVGAYLQQQLREVLSEGEGINIAATLVDQGEERFARILSEGRKTIEESKSRHEAAKMAAPGKTRKEGALCLYGRGILEAGIPAETPGEELKNLTVYGRVSGLDSRNIKGNRTLITFRLISKRSGITCKLFLKKGEEMPPLKDDMPVKAKGNVEADSFLREMVLMVRDLGRYEPDIRKDEAREKRVELHLHTKMSQMDATLELKDLFSRLKELGHEAVALTDHGVVQSYPEAYALSQKTGIKVLYGMEGYLYDDRREGARKGKADHVILLVRSQEGMKNLYRLVSESHLSHFYRTPRIPKSLLTANRQGLLVGSACVEGEIYRSLLQGASREELEEKASYYDYLEIQPLTNNEFLIEKEDYPHVASLADIQDLNKQLLALGSDLGKPVVATGDVHFLDKEDSIYRAILMKSKGYDDVRQAGLYYRTTEEMLREFAYLGEEEAWRVVVEAPKQIAAAIGEIRPIPEGLRTPKIPGAEEQVRKISLEKAATLYGDPLPAEVRERLDRELDSIIGHGFAVLYLIAHKLVKKSNEDGYVVGSRGSVGSSLVATLMDITEVNPLAPHYRCPECGYSEFPKGQGDCGIELPDKDCPKCGKRLLKDGFQIPFETFLGFKGDKVPDIDLNFSGEYQGIIHRYTEEIFGKGKVFKAGTISSVAERTALGLVKKYFEEENLPLPKDADAAAMAKGCVGVKRTTGQHPGGLVVVPEDVDILDFTPVQRPADAVDSDITTTHFDYHSIDSCLVKLDLLGHDDPTMVKYLEEYTGVSVRDVPLDDPGVMSLFRSPEALDLAEDFVETGSLGLPEFGTSFVRGMLLETKPKVFSDLIRISGFSHGTDVWLNNARDLIVGGKVELREAISTRDDIMMYLMEKGLPDVAAFKIMEDVRKGKGLTPEFETLMTENKVPSWYIESCKKISYMFPKAHATAYVVMAFRLGYYKLYHKEAFYAAYFSVRGNLFDIRIFQDLPKIQAGMERIQTRKKLEGNLTALEKDLYGLLEIGCEMHLRGVAFGPISLERSLPRRFLIEERLLIPPFSSIPGLGDKVGAAIARERDISPFLSVEDLKRRCKINNTVLEEMRELGLFHGLPESEQLALFS